MKIKILLPFIVSAILVTSAAIYFLNYSGTSRDSTGSSVSADSDFLTALPEDLEAVSALKRQIESFKLQNEALRSEIDSLENSLAKLASPDEDKIMIDRKGTWTEDGRFIPYQSNARPYGLEIAGEVTASINDASAEAFETDLLPLIFEYVRTESQEALSDYNLTISPDELILSEDGNVRVYFVGEAGLYRNSLGINQTGQGIGNGDPQHVFPNASQRNAFLESIEEAPLKPGDFVDLGNLQSGTPLNLFLVSDGVNNPDAPVFTSDPSLNPDQKNHMVVHGVVGDDALLVGFEDMYGGGDGNFTDVVIALEIGAENIEAFLEQDSSAEIGQ